MMSGFDLDHEINRILSSAPRRRIDELLSSSVEGGIMLTPQGTYRIPLPGKEFKNVIYRLPEEDPEAIEILKSNGYPEFAEFVSRLEALTAEGERMAEALIRTGQQPTSHQAAWALCAVMFRSTVRRAAGFNSRCGLDLMELISEGLLGVFNAASKFDSTIGYFIKPASWYSYQAMQRAISASGELVRVPVHAEDVLNKAEKEVETAWLDGETPSMLLTQLLEPSSLKNARYAIQAKGVNQWPTFTDNDLDMYFLLPYLESCERFHYEALENHPDNECQQPEEEAIITLLREEIDVVLKLLTERQQRVLRLRFGLDDGRCRTLEEVGQKFGLSRERIRQIEAKVLNRLRYSKTLIRRLRHCISRD